MSTTKPLVRPDRLGDAIASRRMNRTAWVITGMLVLFQIIAFADKAVLGLVADDAMRELGITPVQFGFIGSAFFFLYAIVSFATGILASRVSVRWILLVMGLTWAVMQFPMLAGGGAAVLLVTRIVLGGAEGPATAMSLSSAHGWFRSEDRALPSNLIAAGSTLGPVIAAPLLMWVIVTWGWRWAFGVLGIVGLIWTVAWLLIGSDGPFARRRPAEQDRGRAGDAAEPGGEAVEGAGIEVAPPAGRAVEERHGFDSQHPVPVRAILLSGSFVVAVLAGASNFWTQGFLTTWFPKYLGSVIGLTPGEVGWATTFPWVFGAALLLGLGFLGRQRMRGGSTVRASIVLPFSVALVIAGACFLLAPMTGGLVTVALLTVGAGCSVIYPMAPSAMAYAVTPRQRPLVMSALGGLASIGAIISPTAVGVFMDRAGYRAAPKGQPETAEMAANMATGVDHAFLLAGAILLVCGVLSAFFFRPDRTGRRLQSRHAERVG
ncbi:MFS transporter [Geodermatophilus sp. CPCC 206100]|uniref:MFS transporter n=1 Tax=Geodermatophilus sp. CPCC 206100 TaxID=3020054 RepID=UPI003AFFFF6F